MISSASISLYIRGYTIELMVEDDEDGVLIFDADAARAPIDVIADAVKIARQLEPKLRACLEEPQS